MTTWLRWLAVLLAGATWVAPAIAQQDKDVVETDSARKPDGGGAARAEKQRRLAKEAEHLSIGVPHRPSETVELPRLDYRKIPAESRTKKQALQVSAHRDIGEDYSGKWSRTLRDDGRYGYRVVIHSPGAVFIRAHFAGDPPSSAEVYVYGEEGTPSLQGPVRRAGRAGGDGFWGPVVSGEYLYVEVVQDSDEPPAVCIDKISHGYRDPVSQRSDPALPESTYYSCHRDVSCYPWADGTDTGVARIYFEEGGAGYLCTGALVMDQGSSFRNWFLTANHCICDEATANTLVAYFNYRTAYCNAGSANPILADRVYGASYLTGRDVETGSDYALLELQEDPPAGTMYLGWTTADIAHGSYVAGIHHPGGDYQRISFGMASSSAYSILTPFWEVVWSDGLTEAGSSGSPVFTYADKRIIGQLFGHITGVGAGTCSSPYHSFYGKFGVSWNDGLKTYLGAGTPFSDVPNSSVYAKYIQAIANAGITTGCGNGNFCPAANVTRGQMAAFIMRALHGDSFSYVTLPYFSDVPPDNVYFKYVQRLKDDGITAMTGTYGIDGVVSRGQMAAFLVRSVYGENFAYSATPYFTDVPPGNVYFKYIQKLRDSAITVTNGTYNVDSSVTREQMAAFLGRAFLGMQ